MLLDKSEKLLITLDDYEKAKELSTKTKDFSERLKAATRIYETLLQINSTKILFNKNDIYVDLSELFLGLNSALIDLKKSIQEDTANILKPNNFWRMNLSILEDKANQVFIFNWKNYINESIPIDDEKELKIWEQVPELSESARKLQDFVLEVEDLKQQFPSEENLELIKTISEQMNKFLADLDKVGVPDDVSKFLTKAFTVGVPLSEINDELLDWLDKHDMKQYCQVKLVGNE